MYKSLKAYYFPFALLLSIIIGGITGHLLGKSADALKPLADIFINLIFCGLIPLVFFCVATAVARIGELKQLWKILFNMFLTFLFTGIIAGLFMIAVVKLYPPSLGVSLPNLNPPSAEHINLADQLVGIFTVSDFGKLFSHEHILALVFFSFLIGLATSALKEKGKSFVIFLEAGTEVFMKVMTFIMYLAPLGFFAYFAVLIGDLGSQIIDSYLRVTWIYYLSGLFYFIVAFSFYAFLAGRFEGVKKFWKYTLVPMFTALATCSSSASIPANLLAAEKMKINSNIYETVIPLGAMLHKDGSVLGGIVKIAFLFGIFHMSFSGFFVLLLALFVGIMVGTVMGAIPSGGMLGELLILSVYGFPPEALLMIATISIIIDPLATVLNVTGDIISSMLVARLIQGRRWMQI